MLLGPVVGVILFGLYLLFAGQATGTEIGAGIGAAAASAVFAALVHRKAERRFRLRAPWLRVLTVPLAAVALDSFRVGRVLVQALWRRPAGPIGVLAEQPFRPGLDDPPDAARRGLVTLGSSLAPNGYVLSIEHGSETTLLHRLVAVPSSPDREWPL
jgi:hypothetical protein